MRLLKVLFAFSLIMLGVIGAVSNSVPLDAWTVGVAMLGEFFVGALAMSVLSSLVEKEG